MNLIPLQRASARLFHHLGQRFVRLQEWILARPRLAKWFFCRPEETAMERYAQENRWIFSQFGEQERMLADGPRMRFYRELIRRQIDEGDRVIDLGTGTGILAAFASWQGAAKVYALDHSTVIEDAKILASHNDIRNVEFVAMHSSKFTLEEPVDVIVHEQMGDVLFDEDMVANVLDLRDRLLKEGGRILPARFELYCEPVQLRDERAVPFLWELTVEGFDYGPMIEGRPSEESYYHYSSTDDALVDRFLCEPTPLLTVDLETLERSHLPLEVSAALQVVNAGRMDGYAVFFRVLGDDDLTLSTSPLDPDRAPHWGFRILRTERKRVAVGDVIDTTISAEEWPVLDSWRWEQSYYTAEQYRDCFDDGPDDWDDEEDEEEDEAGR